jgi:hypothetical protein
VQTTGTNVQLKNGNVAMRFDIFSGPKKTRYQRNVMNFYTGVFVYAV